MFCPDSNTGIHIFAFIWLGFVFRFHGSSTLNRPFYVYSLSLVCIIYEPGLQKIRIVFLDDKVTFMNTN